MIDPLALDTWSLDHAWIRFPGAIWRLAAQRAGGDKALEARIIAYVTQYAQGETPQQQGGRAATARLTPEERRERARLGGLARQRRARSEET